LRIRTTSVLRDLDAWRERLRNRYYRMLHSITMLFAMLGYSRRGMLLFILLALILVFSIGTAAFACLIVVAFMKLRLNSYRFANLCLSIFPR